MATTSLPDIAVGSGFYEPAPDSWPESLVPSELTIGIVANNTTYENAFTKNLQVGELSNGRGYTIAISAAFNGLNQAEAKQLRAFLASRRGQGKRFLFPLVAGTEPVSSWGNSPRNYGGDSNGAGVLAMVNETRLLCGRQGAAVGTVLVKKGRWVSMDDNNGVRHATVAAADSVVFKSVYGIGMAYIDLAAPIARYAQQGRLISTANPSCEFVLNSDAEGSMTQSPDGLVNAQVNMTSVRRLAVPTLNDLTPQEQIDMFLNLQDQQPPGGPA